jgi:hypothetical protein
LAALAAGIETGSDDVARAAARQADWILRGAVRQRLEHSLIDAALVSGIYTSAADGDAARHVQRVAALQVAGKLDVDVTDPVAVEAAYRTLRTSSPASTPVLTLVVIGAILVMFGALGLTVYTLRHPHRASRPAPVMGTGAFFHGGTPARDVGIEFLFSDTLTNLVIETDAERRGSRDGAPRARRASELRDARVMATYGPALANAWRDLIDALDRWAEVPTRGRRMQQALAELRDRAQAVSDEFANLGLGYYLQADALVDRNAHAMLFMYRVEDVAFVRAGGERRRVLSLRRLDKLDLSLALLGRQTDEVSDPVIMLDRIDEFVADRVMPAFDGSSYPLGDSSLSWSPRGRALMQRAGEAVRRELVAAGATDRASITPIVVATVRRHEARHGIDLYRATPLRYPRPLTALSAGNLRAALELAAYVSQIGNDPTTPQLALWNLATHGFNRDRWGSAESYAAVVVIDGLAKELGIDAGTPVMVDNSRHLDRDRLAAVAIELSAQSSDKLRQAARQLWITLYGEPMLPIVP